MTCYHFYHYKNRRSIMENKYKIEYKLEFYEYWHCGSGLSSGADVDLLVIKDKNGLPFIPGKTIKGLLREAVFDINNLSKDKDKNRKRLIKALGCNTDEKKDNEPQKGDCFFTNAELSQDFQNAILKKEYKDFLFDSFSSTAISEKTGTAKDKSLRRMQVVIPCTLEGAILNIPDKDTFEDFKKGLKFIKRLGQNRNRGLGRCSFTEIKISKDIPDEKTKEKSASVGFPKELLFKCCLKTDIILNQRAATEGNLDSLNFIPGSNFLGITASSLYKEMNKESQLIFHSGKIRFGDAHPAKNNERSLHVPASMLKPKLGKKEERDIYIHHEVTNTQDEAYKEFQPKQCRAGFYLFVENDGINKKCLEVEVNKSFAIKSAYDDINRRSKEKAMFGYESLTAGSEWMFSVYFDSDPSISVETVDKVEKALTGQRRIGRSKTAQYGLVDIELLGEKKYDKVKVEPKKEKNIVLVYAESRLIFEDEYGLPTFQPKAEDFGFPDGEIDWKKSQIRTFQYAPWNFQRQARDADRCGIEKGSVFYIDLKDNKAIYEVDTFVGSYKNEGFGKVIFNPQFLDVHTNTNGKSKYQFAEIDKDKEEKERKAKREKNYDISSIEKTALYKILYDKAEKVKQEREVYKLVNDFVEKAQDTKLFGENFASQWGSIRQTAMRLTTKKELEKELFDYLTHGVAKDKWEGRRLNEFKKFFNGLDEKIVQMAIINLAAEMAKISRRK